MKPQSIAQKLKTWDGKSKLTAKEFAVMKSMETRETKQVLAALKTQRISTLTTPKVAVVFIKKIGGQ